MTTLNQVVDWWNAAEDNPTDEQVTAWFEVAQNYVAHGGALPDYMQRRYRLMSSGAQGLPPVVVVGTPEPPSADLRTVLPWVLGLAALVWATRR